MSIFTGLILWLNWRFSIYLRHLILWFLSTIELTCPPNSLLLSSMLLSVLMVQRIERHCSHSVPKKKRRRRKSILVIVSETKRTLVRILFTVDGAVTFVVLIVGADGCWGTGLATDWFCSKSKEIFTSMRLEKKPRMMFYQRRLTNGFEPVRRSVESCSLQSWLQSRNVY